MMETENELRPPRMSMEEAIALSSAMTDADFPTVAPAEDVSDALVQRLVAAARGVGRPSLTAPGKHSPMLNLRVSEAMKADLERVAAIKGVRQSDVVREALDRWLNEALVAA